MYQIFEANLSHVAALLQVYSSCSPRNASRGEAFLLRVGLVTDVRSCFIAQLVYAKLVQRTITSEFGRNHRNN